MGGRKGKTRGGLGSLGRHLGALRGGPLKTPPGYVPSTGHDGHHAVTSTRRTVHLGHQIEVRTTYEILIDGEPVQEHVMALEDGTVHYHGLPNYSFPSAVELARRMVDRLLLAPVEDELNPTDGTYGQPSPSPTPAGGAHHHGGHHHDPA